MRPVVISTIFTALATVFVAIRLWTRFKLVNSPGRDDVLIFCALVCLIPMPGMRRENLSTDGFQISSYMFFAFLIVGMFHHRFVVSAIKSNDYQSDIMDSVFLKKTYQRMWS